MHEMSLTVSLLDIIREEMRRHNASRLRLVRVRAGALANVVPEALQLAFSVQTAGSDIDGAKLEIIEEALRLACGGCGLEYESETPGRAALFAPCPSCGEEIGHKLLAGKELYIDNIEVD